MSRVVYIGHIPLHWTTDNMKSLLAGTGKVLEVRLKLDPVSARNKGYCFVEYPSYEDAVRAVKLLSEVRVNGRRLLRVELQKDALRTSGDNVVKPVMTLSRDFMPEDVVLPSGMMYSSEFGASSSASLQTKLPHYLSEASTNLPPMVNGSLDDSESKIAKNLASLPPAQLIQVIASLKNFLVDGDSKSAASVLTFSPQLTISVAQALFVMGFVDNNVIKAALSNSTTSSATSSANSTTAPAVSSSTSSASFASYGNPHMQQQQQQHYQRPVSRSSSATLHTPPPTSVPANPALPALPAIPKFPHKPQPQTPAIPPAWRQFPPSTIGKLMLLDRQQADMIAQVLLLTPAQLMNVPMEQKAAIDQIRAQYFGS